MKHAPKRMVSCRTESSGGKITQITVAATWGAHDLSLPNMFAARALHCIGRLVLG